MRHIGSISDETQAIRFCDYLQTLGIDNSVEEGAGGGWAVWVSDDDDVERSKAEMQQFLQSPDDARYRSATGAAQKIRAAEEKDQQRRRKHYVDVRTRWSGLAVGGYPLTLALILIAGAAAAMTQLGHQMEPVGEWLRFASIRTLPTDADFQYVDWPADMAQGQVWRLVTPIFLHFGFIHLIFNFFWVRDLGSAIETRKGTLLLLALVLVSAVISNSGQYIASEDPFFGGLSGVVYALFGYVLIQGRLQPHEGLGVSQNTMWIMFAWLFICMTGWVGPIANTAHVLGLIVGVAFAYVPYAGRRLMRKWRGLA